MQISSRFTIAVHTLLLIVTADKGTKVTSSFIASSVCVHPVIIRRTLAALKHANMISVQQGTGGASLARPATDISLYDIYRAADCAEKNIFGFHEKPNPSCPVGANIHPVLDGHLTKAQQAFEDVLKQTTLAMLVGELEETVSHTP